MADYYGVSHWGWSQDRKIGVSRGSLMVKVLFIRICYFSHYKPTKGEIMDQLTQCLRAFVPSYSRLFQLSPGAVILAILMVERKQRMFTQQVTGTGTPHQHLLGSLHLVCVCLLGDFQILKWAFNLLNSLDGLTGCWLWLPNHAFPESLSP